MTEFIKYYYILPPFSTISSSPNSHSQCRCCSSTQFSRKKSFLIKKMAFNSKLKLLRTIEKLMRRRLSPENCACQEMRMRKRQYESEKLWMRKWFFITGKTFELDFLYFLSLEEIHWSSHTYVFVGFNKFFMSSFHTLYSIMLGKLLICCRSLCCVCNEEMCHIYKCAIRNGFKALNSAICPKS